MRNRENIAASTWERAAIVLCFVALAFLGGWLWQSSRSQTELPPLFEDAPLQGRNVKLINSVSPTQISVHVAGAVNKAGVLSLPAHSRVIEAIRRAGGMRPDAMTESLNLAAKLEDGQQVFVISRGRQARNLVIESKSRLTSHGVTSTQKPAKPGLTTLININLATTTELEMLPGIGPALAARIIAFRNENGAINSIRDLDRVKGIGTAKIEKLKPWVRF